MNTSGSDLTGIYVGLAADLDVGIAGNDRAGYDAARRLTYVYETGTVTNPNYYGMTALSAELSGHAAWSAANATSDTGQALLYQRLATLGTVPTNASDVRSIIGTGPHTIVAGRNVRVLFALVAGASLSELQANTDAALAIRFNLSPTVISIRDVPDDQGGHVTLRWNLAEV